MNESELRRQELLRQTRRLYNDHNELPAVHPRYGRICSSLYGDGRTAAEQHIIRRELLCPAGDWHPMLRILRMPGPEPCRDRTGQQFCDRGTDRADMDADALIETLASP